MKHIETSVRPNAATHTYLAVGLVEGQTFTRRGYPKDFPDLKMTFVGSDDLRNRHKVSYERWIALDIPDGFPFAICRVNRDGGGFEVLFAPATKGE